MASQVFLHIGLPKTGTTYLQSVLWGSEGRAGRRRLPAPGSRPPRAPLGRARAAGAAPPRAAPRQGARHAEPGWSRRSTATGGRRSSPTSSCAAPAASRPGASSRRSRPAEVHLVVTARDTLGMLTSGWAEYVKNGGTKPLSEMHGDRLGGQAEFGWRTWDLGGVLRRWGRHVPPEQVHVLPMPGPGQPRDQHWRNFAGVLGLDPDRYDAPEEPRNPALGVVQIELLRRVNPHLTAFRRPVDRGTWIRGYLAEGHLVRQDGRAAGRRRRPGGRVPRAGGPRRTHDREAGLPGRRRRREPAGARGAARTATPGHRVE